MGPGEVFGLLILIGIPTIMLVYLARRFFTFREKQLEAETSLAAEKAAQYAASNTQLEARLPVEQSSRSRLPRPLRKSRRCARSPDLQRRQFHDPFEWWCDLAM